MMLASDSENVLKCGAAINPIVSFKYYNSFFTERYVIQPADNGRALLDSDLSMKVGNFASKKYLLIHGTADTQVHEQHTAILTKSLIEVGVMFRHQVYVDENHSLSAANQTDLRNLLLNGVIKLLAAGNNNKSPIETCNAASSTAAGTAGTNQ
ncbi:hypothetical protein pipiens_017432 [Culex pipiens pipiens]|uniref:Peptidase S9 prolyl oligopeptidase catalytic domain-containing protein n=1 Tax=Culex pipiens pipiens TaxID=38569 RepID=A0ABD1CGV7_CULPP